MRATKAYIASLGTTGVLLAAALLMLAVVGAVVAFDRWPSGHVSTRVQAVLIAERAHGVRISLASARAGAPARAARRGRLAGRLPVVHVPGSGGPGLQRVAGERIAAGHTTTPNGGSVKRTIPSTPKLPPLPDPRDVNPQSLAGTVAGQAESATGQTGGSLGQVSPAAGQAVSETGAQAAGAVRSLPLPGPLVP